MRRWPSSPKFFALVNSLATNEALAEIMKLVGQINGYLEVSKPWQKAKAGHPERVATILYHAAEALRLASVLLHPVIPERTLILWRSLGWEPSPNLADGLDWGLLPSGDKGAKGGAAISTGGGGRIEEVGFDRLR